MATLGKPIVAGLLAGLVLSGGTAAADEATPSWLAGFQQELRAAWVRPDITTHGKVRFVAGNNILVAGRQFKDGGNWLALACTARACRLEPAMLQVKNENRKGGGQRLLFGLRMPSEAGVIAWFHTGKAPGWLELGDVPAYFPGFGRPRETGTGTLEARIDLPGGETASLVPMLLNAPEADTPLPPMLLQLRAQGRRQLLPGQLGRCSHTTDSAAYLLWAGDLDRDGRPDYLISFVDLDGPVHLYLSGEAKAGQLVGLAGVYNVPPAEAGCNGARQKE